MRYQEDSFEWIGYTVNDLNDSIFGIDYNSPIMFIDITKGRGVGGERGKLEKIETQ